MGQNQAVIYLSSCILLTLTGCNSSNFNDISSSSDTSTFSLPNNNVQLARSAPLSATENAASSTVTEAVTTNFFQLSLSAAMSVEASVSYQTKDGTAIAGQDYSSVADTATIPVGSTSVLIGVPILNDTSSEFSETFSLVISNPSGAIFPTGITEITATHTILDDDASSSAPIDITNAILTNSSANCADYVNSYQSSVKDVSRSINFNGNLTIAVSNNKCTFNSNAIPNHDFQDDGPTFASDVAEQTVVLSTTTTPQVASNTTALSLQYDNAIFLNGVKLDLLSAGCFGVSDGKSDCFDESQPWRYDPMSPLNNFGTDTHNAHPQPPAGEYHYHGSPVAMFYTDTAVVSPVIGFAADGFPVYGSYFDDNGTIRKATSSYQLKSGSRVTVNGINPNGSYDGQYVDDYQYVSSAGDLDACNGMTQNGSYAYYITDSYPWVIGCFTGTPDSSFRKN